VKDLYVDGQWRAPRDGASREIIDPLDQRVVRTVAEAGVEDVHDAIAAARRAFDESDWSRLPGAERGRLLGRLADAIEADREQLAALETDDTGKTLVESRMDMDDIAGVVRYYAGLADKDAGEVVDAPIEGLRSVVHREPVGVCGQISPWNYPLLQASWKLAPALAAGNTIVVKPAELTPLTTIRVFELMEEVGLPARCGQPRARGRVPVGAELSTQPDVDLMSFTGGIETGQQVMRAAAGNVKKIALELGGKNPNIVFADADFDHAVDHALLAVFLHAGQVCSAGRAPAGRGPPSTTSSSTRSSPAPSGSVSATGDDPKTRVGAAHLRRAPRQGRGHVARHSPRARPCAAAASVPRTPPWPTASSTSPPSSPAAPGHAHRRAGGVRTGAHRRALLRRGRGDRPRQRHHLRACRRRSSPTDLARAERVAAGLRLGTVWINDFHPYFPQAPWGGYKRSGIGRELGPEGLEEYTGDQARATQPGAAALDGLVRHEGGRTSQDAGRRHRGVRDAGEPKLVCEGLWKVFGPRPERIVGSPEADLPRDELMERTGCVAPSGTSPSRSAQGEMFVVMGLSGSGKSTLVRCLTRLIEPTAGRCASTAQTSRARAGELRELRRRGQHGVPALRAAAQPQGARQRGLRPRDPGVDRVERAVNARGESSTSSASPASPTLPGRAVRRHEAAGRPRPGARRTTRRSSCSTSPSAPSTR
jgi:betaine-aldehyde dehydrogenase